MPKNNHSDNFSDDETPLDDETLWDLLSLYVDGEADPEQAAIVERMLNSDPAYRRDFDFLMQSSQVLHTMEEVAPPEGLRDAIYATTSRRPTLVGRLRAAWGRIALPTVGRYTGIGGAFAAAALAVLFLWPHRTTTPPGSLPPSHSTEVASGAPAHTETLPTPPQTGPVVDIHVPPFSVETPTHPRPSREQGVARNTPKSENRPIVVPDPRKSGAKGGPSQYASGTKPTPNTPKPGPTRSVQAPNESVAGNNIGGPRYAYDPQMDRDSAQNRKMTIFNAANEDIGPMVVVPQHDDTPVQPPQHIDPPTPTASAGNTGDATPDPKPRVRIAAVLPPDAKQNIATSLIRRDITNRYSGYDRSVAESIQRHEVTIDVIKGSF